MLRTGRAAVYLAVQSITPSGGSLPLHSDVFNSVTATVDADEASAIIQIIAKNQSATVSPLNDITLTRYHVEFKRTDGRNTPGVDVPFPFDGALAVTGSAAGTGSVGPRFSVVREQAKLESPLRNLRSGGGQIVISAIAEITFYGHDQNGNEISAVGQIDVQFSDF
jgi:hypothetical protein